MVLRDTEQVRCDWNFQTLIISKYCMDALCLQYLTHHNSDFLVHLGISAVIGVILGILSLYLYRLGVFAVGQCLGLVRFQSFCVIFYITSICSI